MPDTKEPQDASAKDEKRPVGRPPEMVVKIDDTPDNVAKALFGIKSDKPVDAPVPQTD